MPVPSGALAGASVGAMALARIVSDLAGSLALNAATATAIGTSTRRVVRVLAPRVASAADVGAIGAELATDVQAIARAAVSGDAAPALYAAATSTRGACPLSASPVLMAQYALARALAASIEVTCLGEAFLAEARTDFADRSAASAARDRITTACDAAADRIAVTLGQVVLGILLAVARQTSAFLVEKAATVQPIVRVDAMRSFPSTAIAWSLYEDPTRAPELVARNRCGTPLFMPSTFEAVSPGV